MADARPLVGDRGSRLQAPPSARRPHRALLFSRKPPSPVRSLLDPREQRARAAVRESSPVGAGVAGPRNRDGSAMPSIFASELAMRIARSELRAFGISRDDGAAIIRPHRGDVVGHRSHRQEFSFLIAPSWYEPWRRGSRERRVSSACPCRRQENRPGT
jgi:hypothetical protein